MTFGLAESEEKRWMGLGLSKAQSRSTRPVWSCPELRGKLRTAALGRPRYWWHKGLLAACAHAQVSSWMPAALAAPHLPSAYPREAVVRIGVQFDEAVWVYICFTTLLRRQRVRNRFELGCGCYQKARPAV
ncbi:unnamed protein product [Effrenium voratum]|nr:unnamed protein product [Effrenium voratum]